MVARYRRLEIDRPRRHAVRHWSWKGIISHPAKRAAIFWRDQSSQSRRRSRQLFEVANNGVGHHPLTEARVVMISSRARWMPRYRVYIFNERGDLAGAVDFDCADDEGAIERVEELGADDAELWRQIELLERDEEERY
jgi:hypothetical protein